jgi:hypothetical protein
MPLFGCPATFCISETEIEPHGKRSLTSRFKATQLISTQPSLKSLNPISQPDFDRLTLYLAVASELRKEPFFSEDNPPERLTPSNDGRFWAHFGHPAFLKSAMVPFRKLWLGSEQCAFEKVRDRIFEVHPDQGRIPAERFVFCDVYAQNLNASPASDWASESTKDILNIWIYTQGIHAGQLENRQGKVIRPADPTLRDFDDCAKRIGERSLSFCSGLVFEISEAFTSNS